MSKQKFYPDEQANPDFSSMEEEILSFWQDNDVFKKSVDNRPTKTKDGNNNEFIFYDGPPFANGLPHYGHLLTGFVKDIFARYQTMKGKRVERRFGWDCHGLPAEMGAEKDLGISGRNQIIEYGIENFNNYCRESVMKFADEWQKYVDRQGRWVDFANDYKTMDVNYMESVLWAFKELFDKGLVYESMRVMPYSWACETPLSNFETRLDNAYRERKDKAVTVAFTLIDRPEFAPEGFAAYKLLAWTTTPWTLPSNLALAVGTDIEYALIKHKQKDDNCCYIIAKSSLANYSNELDENIITTVKGRQLLGLTYHPLFPFFVDYKEAFKVFAADFVAEGDGTAIVHIAPGFGEDDQKLGEQNGLPIVCPVDNAGNFTDEVFDLDSLSLKKRNVLTTNDDIIKYLKVNNSWIKTEQYIHNYPHCWRTDTPLIYKAVPSWYVNVTEFKDKMVELNQQINWIPAHIKDGLFGKWLENARDWSISRNRFWGTPIPVWKSDNPANKNLYVFGSIKELENFFGKKINDLHRPYIDELTAPDPENPDYTIKRVEDVFDCWFESGSMPYAQVHYPFENRLWFEEHFPANFIVEYVAQTRGWFYTLMVLATGLFERPPFLDCICHGVVLDSKGQKLSKRLNNYADPMQVFTKFGADAMRWVMVSSPIMHGGELLIDKEGNMVRDAVRLVLKPVWNAYNFFTLYANADAIRAELLDNRVALENMMDKYILAKCAEKIISIEKAMDSYDTQSACKEVELFFEVLNNWYIRRNKDRFWKEEKDQDKQAAYNVLYSVLCIMCKTISPLLPYLTEKIWRGLNNDSEFTSVHLQDYPDVNKFVGEEELITHMDIVRDACNAALSIRNTENLRVRLPLNKLTLVAKDTEKMSDFIELIKDEVNVKNIEFSNDITAFAEYKLKINFPVLAKRLPDKIKQIIPATKQGQWQQLDNNKISIAGETLQQGEYELLLEPKQAKGAQSLSSNNALVILDLNVTEELKQEGIARDIIRLVQQSRKKADLIVTDRINLAIYANDEFVNNSIHNHKDYIALQTLASSLKVKKDSDNDYNFEDKLGDNVVSINFSVR